MYAPLSQPHVHAHTSGSALLKHTCSVEQDKVSEWQMQTIALHTACHKRKSTCTMICVHVQSSVQTDLSGGYLASSPGHSQFSNVAC